MVIGPAKRSVSTWYLTWSFFSEALCRCLHHSSCSSSYPGPSPVIDSGCLVTRVFGGIALSGLVHPGGGGSHKPTRSQGRFPPGSGRGKRVGAEGGVPPPTQPVPVFGRMAAQVWTPVLLAEDQYLTRADDKPTRDTAFSPTPPQVVSLGPKWKDSPVTQTNSGSSLEPVVGGKDRHSWNVYRDL